MPKHVIGITGFIGSGKGAAAKYFETKYGATVIAFSDSLREVMEMYDIPIDREALQVTSTFLRQTFGDDTLARAVKKRVEAAKTDIVVVEGMRRVPDIRLFKDDSRFFMIMIESEEQLRHERIRGRNQNQDDSTISFEEFKRQEQSEPTLPVPEVIATAKITLTNDGTFDELYQQIDEMMSSFKS